MKRMKTLTCIVLALSLLLGLGLAGAQAESAGKIVVFQQKTEIYDQLVELAKTRKKRALRSRYGPSPATTIIRT